MAYDPVLWLLVYLLIGSLIWMHSVASGDFEGSRPRDAVVSSVVMIVVWLPLIFIVIAACIAAARVMDES